MGLKRYAIWDKTSHVYTPVGEDLTPEEWIDRYSWINNPAAVPIVSKGLINGSYCGELSQMMDFMIDAAKDEHLFDDCSTNEEILLKIEELENIENMPSTEPSAEERIASALEYQNLLAE